MKPIFNSVPASVVVALADERERAAKAWEQERPFGGPIEPPPKNDAAWMSRYNEYLGSPEWEARRQKVFERCGGVCEACRDAPATQVHHLSYAHVGREPLFDLRGVCPGCHNALHGESSAYPVNPLMVSAAEWLHGARTWLNHIRTHLKTLHGETFIPDKLADRIGGAFDRLKTAVPVETSEGREEAKALWFDVWAACQQLTDGKLYRHIGEIEGFYLPKTRKRS